MKAAEHKDTSKPDPTNFALDKNVRKGRFWEAAVAHAQFK